MFFFCFVLLAISYGKHRCRTPILDEHRLHNLLPNRHVVARAIRALYPHLARIAVVANYSHCVPDRHFLVCYGSTLKIIRPLNPSKLTFSFMKESPRWLISKGRVEEAYRVVFKHKLKDNEFSEKLQLSRKADAEAEVCGYTAIIDNFQS